MLTLSQGQICSNVCKSCLIEIEAADQIFYLTHAQYTDTRPTSPCADYRACNARRLAGSHWMPIMNIHKSLVWLHLQSDPWYKQVSNPGLPLSRQTPLPLGQLDCFSVCNNSTTVQIITFSLHVMGLVEAGDEMPIDSFTPSFKVTLWLFPFFYRCNSFQTEFCIIHGLTGPLCEACFDKRLSLHYEYDCQKQRSCQSQQHVFYVVQT